MRTWKALLVVVLAGCGGGGKKAPAPAAKQGPPAAAAPVKLCVDLTDFTVGFMGMGAGYGVGSDDQARFDALLGLTGANYSPLWWRDEPAHKLLIWSQCSETACRAEVVRLEGPNTALKVASRVALPRADRASPAEGGPSPNGRMFHDVGGKQELWLTYSVPGQPQPAVGADVDEDFVVLTLPDLDIALHTTLGTTPGASMGEACEGHFTHYDLDCDKQDDILIERNCQLKMCRDAGEGAAEKPECVGERPLVTRIPWLRRDDRYQQGTPVTAK